jgi:hypothetical protein
VFFVRPPPNETAYFVMSTSLVSGRKKKPTTAVIEAKMIGYHRPRRYRRSRPRSRTRSRQQSAEPAVADVIGQRHRGVADLGREQFDQHRRDRPVHHGDVDHQDEQQADHGRDLRTEDVERVRHLHDLAFAALRISRFLQGRRRAALDVRRFV